MNFILSVFEDLTMNVKKLIGVGEKNYHVSFVVVVVYICTFVVHNFVKFGRGKLARTALKEKIWRELTSRL